MVQFINLLVPALERFPIVERYSWFSDFAYRGSGSSALFDNWGNLTAVGRAYRDAK